MLIYVICLLVFFFIIEYLKIVFILERYKNYVIILILCFILVFDDGLEIIYVLKYFIVY